MADLYYHRLGIFPLYQRNFAGIRKASICKISYPAFSSCLFCSQPSSSMYCLDLYSRLQRRQCMCAPMHRGTASAGHFDFWQLQPVDNFKAFKAYSFNGRQSRQQSSALGMKLTKQPLRNNKNSCFNDMNQIFLTSKNFCRFLCSPWCQVSTFISVLQLLIFVYTKCPSAMLGNLTINEQMNQQVQRHCKLQ